MFFSRKKIFPSVLPEGMTDLHTHLLPGVDDGVQTMEESLSALACLRNLGVEQIYLTPHVMADLPENTPRSLLVRYEALLKACPDRPQLRLAAEYMLDAAFAPSLEKGLLTMPNRHVLVETSYLAPPPDLAAILYGLTMAGYTPVIAHPERYMYMHERDCRLLKDRGCKLQLNLFSLSGAYGKQVGRNAATLLKQGLYDYTGSDIHRMASYREWLGALSPSRTQLAELMRLAGNNARLWEMGL